MYRKPKRDKETDRPANGLPPDRYISRQAGQQAGRQKDRHTDRQTGRQAGRQTDGQTDRQKDRLRNIYQYCIVVFCCTVNTVHMWY